MQQNYAHWHLPAGTSLRAASKTTAPFQMVATLQRPSMFTNWRANEFSVIPVKSQYSNLPALNCFPDLEQRSVHSPTNRIMTGNEAAASLAARIRQGLTTLTRGSSRSTAFRSNDAPQDLVSSTDPGLAQIETNVWLQSEELSVTNDSKLRESDWNLKILASNILLYRQSQVKSEDEIPITVSNVNNKTRLRWRNTASILNMLVSGLWPTWGNKACLVFEVIASRSL